MKRFVGIEIGKSAYTEFKMKDGTFENTEDGIFLGVVDAKDEAMALEEIKRQECNKNRSFDNIVLFEIQKV